MLLATTRFGEVSIDDEKIITFPDGLPGFEELTRFALLSNAEIAPIHWLQSLDDTSIALAVVNPFTLLPDYAPMIDEDVFTKLGLDNEDDALVLTTAVIPDQFRDMTTNLAAPIIINVKRGVGLQTLLALGDYNLREPVYEAVRNYVLTREKEGDADAGSGA